VSELVSEILEVAAALSENLGRQWTEADARAYLERRGLTPRAFLEENAAFVAKCAAYEPRPIPDPETEPELYEQYLQATYPINSLTTLDAWEQEQKDKAKGRAD
jgi:hypothetical protein